MPQSDTPMRRDFESRNALIAYLRQEFPSVVAVDGHIPSAWRGGHAQAKKKLAAVDPVAYQATRNHLEGKVTHLSPYIRHGILSLAEVRDHALKQVADPNEAEKLINELGWRDYFQRVYADLGDRIWQDLEPYKTGFSSRDYADELPDDIRIGTTDTCLDPFCRQLIETGYLHNHARMWLAAYVVHWRRIKWQAGAAWFLEHLLDGDPASNNLSWQWVASTFSHKPYFFNKSNLKKFGGTTFQCHCKFCPFEGSYPDIQRRLFPSLPAEIEAHPRKGNKKRKRMHQ